MKPWIGWRSQKQSGVPRRFGVGAMMVITTMYAVLFATIQSTPGIVFGFIAMFFTVVGVCQAVLFNGRDPRRASIVSGMIAGSLILPLAMTMSWQSFLGIPLFAVIILVIVYGLFGAPAGYLAGGLIAGVFLLFNKWQPPLDAGEPTPGEKAIDLTQLLQIGEARSPFTDQRPDNPAGGGNVEQ
jgi:hypothetical protein